MGQSMPLGPTLRGVKIETLFGGGPPISGSTTVLSMHWEKKSTKVYWKRARMIERN